jgi:hypothetical protein
MNQKSSPREVPQFVSRVLTANTPILRLRPDVVSGRRGSSPKCCCPGVKCGVSKEHAVNTDKILTDVAESVVGVEAEQDL